MEKSDVFTHVYLITYAGIRPCPTLQPYRSETQRISLFREHSGRTNDVDTIDTLRFATIRLKWKMALRIVSYCLDS